MVSSGCVVCLVSGVRSRVFGVRSQVSGLRCQVSGLRSQVSGLIYFEEYFSVCKCFASLNMIQTLFPSSYQVERLVLCLWTLFPARQLLQLAHHRLRRHRLVQHRVAVLHARLQHRHRELCGEESEGCRGWKVATEFGE